jgi:hypothetical protein
MQAAVTIGTAFEWEYAETLKSDFARIEFSLPEFTLELFFVMLKSRVRFCAYMRADRNRHAHLHVWYDDVHRG